MLLTDSGNTFEAAPAGVHPARLFKIIDLGTQESSFQGQTKKSRKLLLSFELLGDDYMTDGRPFTVSRRFTASMGEKSALRPFLEGWRGKKYTPEELKAGLHLDKMLGGYGLLSLVDSERDGRQYSNIASISALPKSMSKPEGVNPLQLFDLSVPDWSVFDGLSEKMQTTILQSPEGEAAGKARRTKQEPNSNPFADLADDDIPF